MEANIAQARQFFAHSVAGQPEQSWQPLSAHLHEVQRLAREFANGFPWGRELAGTSGLWHDLGKYTIRFQDRLQGNPERVNHSTWGARLAIEKFGKSGAGWVMAYAIAGHHAGLANGQGEGRRSSLAMRLAEELPPLETAWQDELNASGPCAFPPAGFKPHMSRDSALLAFQLAFLVRMIFSCLVDADFLDTETFYNQAEGRDAHRLAPAPSLEVLRSALNMRLSAFKADTPVNATRASILQHVRARAELPPGLFSLTVPTGGGKTLASLAFALDHAIRHGQQRVIFVIPFTSVVEQNAAVFREALGSWGEAAVLEHHSAFNDDTTHSREAREKIRLAMENWDTPVVVTTAVQFFESLFADRPAKCRKLHNIANSVIILDEAQTMPLKLLRPCVAAIDELARNYRSSLVLCTATQPALNALSHGLVGVKELAPDPPKLFEQLKRVTVRYIGTLDDSALLARLREREQVLCIVNNRRHARALHEGLADLPGSHHLTTLMCAAHRSQVMTTVREALRRKQPCRLVSTSLIEAGVDVSFPTVYRAEAGLDSVAQAAGRCNREGLWTAADSEVNVFANDDWKPPAELSQFAGAAREVLRNHQGDPLEPAAIERYFQELYSQKGEQELDGLALLSLLKTSQLRSLPFDTLAEKFKLIDSVQMPVIIPFDDQARETIKALSFAEGVQHLARRLQRYLVQVPRQGYDALRKAGAIQPIQPDRWGEQFMVLMNESLYDPMAGLSWDDPCFIAASALCL